MHTLTGFQRDCLVVIAGEGPVKGLSIKDELDGYYGSEINHGRLYPNLDSLVEAGLVEKGRIDDRTNSYELTDAGRELLAERFEWEDRYVDI
jgi:DNA-binding PadR family transcriptional regulator